MPNKQRTKKGENAISSIIRTSRDSIVKTVKDRYTGKRAPLNIAKDIKTIMSLMNTENKHVDTVATAQTVHNTSSLVYGIGTVAQGSADNQRTGDSIKVDSIDLLFDFIYSSGTPATSATQDQMFNWYLVRYLKTPSSSGTVAFNISEFLNQDGNSNYTPISLPNTDTNENFQVMSSGQVSIMLPYLPTVSSNVHKVVEVSHKCSFHQTYSGSASTTIVDNMTFLVFTAISPLNTGGLSSVTVSARMWYIDN